MRARSRAERNLRGISERLRANPGPKERAAWQTAHRHATRRRLWPRSRRPSAACAGTAASIHSCAEHVALPANSGTGKARHEYDLQSCMHSELRGARGRDQSGRHAQAHARSGGCRRHTHLPSGIFLRPRNRRRRHSSRFVPRARAPGDPGIRGGRQSPRCLDPAGIACGYDRRRPHQQPQLPDRPVRAGRGALRQDPHVRRQPGRGEGLSGIGHHRARWPGGRRRNAVGRDWPLGLLRSQVRGPLSHARQGWRVHPHRTGCLYQTHRRGPLARPEPGRAR